MFTLSHTMSNLISPLKVIRTGHTDVIHDIAYDYYGIRIASCSNDQTVKVWDRSGNGVWKCTSTWKAHCESVKRVIWSDPYFGQIIVTCSNNKTAAVWEETHKKLDNKIIPKWIMRYCIHRSSPVVGISFSPKCCGLLLAVLGADGIVTIHEADQINLSDWVTRWVIACNAKCTSIDWNTYITTDGTALIAVGCEDLGNGENKVLIYELKIMEIWSKMENVCVIREAVKDVCFAPNIGRSFELLAVATIAGVNIIKITNKPKTNQTVLSGTSTQTDNDYCCEIVASLYDHETVVWRLSWNVVGSILASRGDDECVRLWKYGNGQWNQCTLIKDDIHYAIASIASIDSINSIDSRSSSSRSSSSGESVL